MPRTDVPVRVLTDGGNAVQTLYTTIDATLVTNGVRVVNAGAYRRIKIIVKNTAVAAKVLTVQSGVHSHAILGDTTVSVAANTGEAHVFTNSMRHEQADQSLHLDFEAGFTGSLIIVAEPAVG